MKKNINVRNRQSFIILCLLIFMLLTLSIRATPTIEKYGLPDKPWEEKFGNHRTVLNIENPNEVIRLKYLWRRHDKNPEARHLMILNKDSGEKIKNILRININNEVCDILFGPVKEKGTYYFYYLPYLPEEDAYHAGKYLEREDEPDKEWLTKNNLSEENINLSNIKQARVLEIQARNEFHSFFPMEVIATDNEVKQYKEKYNDSYLIFPEDRSRPIRMLDALPAIWLQDEPSTVFKGTAQRNEYYTFQVGVFASNILLENLQINFSDLRNRNGELIPSSLITCFNTHGIDINGKSFTKIVNVPQGKIQPLWVGIDISKNARPGIYEGIFTIRAKNQKEKQLKIELEILDNIIEDRGDSELWRHSRLRWLNSTIGIDDEPVRPFTDLELNDREISCLGRKVILDEYGLPLKVSSWGNEILASSVKFLIESNNKIIQLSAKDFSFTEIKNGIISWEAISENDELSLSCKGEMEFDGRMNYICNITAKKDIILQDIRIEIPYKKEIAKYMIGMGRMGGFTPSFHRSRWRKDEDSFWLGNQQGGIHCELRGGSYHGPLLNLYQPYPPSCWYNGESGGFWIDTKRESITAAAYSGYRAMKARENIKYEFALIITPVKKYNPNDQFNFRYAHTPYPSQKIIESGGNVMNVHHANEYNPFINYPFIANEKLKGLVEKWHEKNWKIKIYYTVRELSNHITEIWALRSLGFEVLADGPGGGYQWLQEHLVDHYTPQWYTHLGNGTVDAAILNSGESRWYNYYLEGLAWLLKEIDIDGLYLDDFSYDRRILKRVRKIMEKIKPDDCYIDVHSNTAFSKSPANQYLEIYPYIDRTWYGEGFNFDIMPSDFWFSEVSGIPFGVVNELLLHRSINNGRRGMVYAMAPRADWGMWQFWDQFEITESEMIGYWDSIVPIKTDKEGVFATLYLKNDQVLIVLGNWLNEPTNVCLEINWDMLGLKEEEVRMEIPEIKNYQKKGTVEIREAIPIEAKSDKFLIISKKISE